MLVGVLGGSLQCRHRLNAFIPEDLMAGTAIREGKKALCSSRERGTRWIALSVRNCRDWNRLAVSSMAATRAGNLICGVGAAQVWEQRRICGGKIKNL